MAVRTVIPDLIPEKSTWRYTGVLKDEKAVAIPAASLTTLTLTLYNLETLAIINSLDGINILNTNRGTVDANGNLAITLHPADNLIVDTTKIEETHMMLLQWTYAAGVEAGRHEVEFKVRNLDKVT